MAGQAKKTQNIIIKEGVRVKLPPLFPIQQAIKDDPHRFKVLVAGRRFGKSTLALDIVLDDAINAGKVMWFVSPTYNNVMIHWRNAKRMVGNLATYKNEQQKYMEFNFNGRMGSVSFKSGDRPDNLLGVGLDGVVVDEAAYQNPEIWYRVLRPALSDKEGNALLISTPNGVANWFYRAYLAGVDPSEPEWESWIYRTVDNPVIKSSEVENARRDLPDLKFRQEYLAEFVSDAGGVFRNLENAAVLPILTEPIAGHSYIAGVDWGRKNDFTVFSIFDTNGNQVFIDRFTEIGWQVQRDRLVQAHEKWNFRRLYIESNAAGGPNIEALQAEGLPIEPVFMTNVMKTELVERLAANLERGLVKLISHTESIGQQQLGELQSYAITRTHSGLNVTYNAPRGWNDDMVVATMLANMGLSSRVSHIIQAVVNPFYGGRRDPIEKAQLNAQEIKDEKYRRMVNK